MGVWVCGCRCVGVYVPSCRAPPRHTYCCCLFLAVTRLVQDLKSFVTRVEPLDDCSLAELLCTATPRAAARALAGKHRSAAVASQFGADETTGYESFEPRRPMITGGAARGPSPTPGSGAGAASQPRQGVAVGSVLKVVMRRHRESQQGGLPSQPPTTASADVGSGDATTATATASTPFPTSTGPPPAADKPPTMFADPPSAVPGVTKGLGIRIKSITATKVVGSGSDPAVAAPADADTSAVNSSVLTPAADASGGQLGDGGKQNEHEVVAGTGGVEDQDRAPSPMLGMAPAQAELRPQSPTPHTNAPVKMSGDLIPASSTAAVASVAAAGGDPTTTTVTTVLGVGRPRRGLNRPRRGTGLSVVAPAIAAGLSVEVPPRSPTSQQIGERPTLPDTTNTLTSRGGGQGGEEHRIPVNRCRAKLIVNVLRILQKLTKRFPNPARALAASSPTPALKKCQTLKFLPAAVYYALKLLKQQVGRYRGAMRLQLPSPHC